MCLRQRAPGVAAEWGRDAWVVANGGTAIDLALLEITPTLGQAPVVEVPPTRCGRMDSDIPGPLSGCVAVGYPRHAVRPEAPFSTAEVDGWSPIASGFTYTALAYPQRIRCG